ncbi:MULTISPECIES: MFS transporter [unclassified Methanoculleus]|jgi:MFS family permease|uniref:MFS transporter n=1 Tax=unclassified Methanoculleus TaxID=2619537 RepID=UPI00319DCCEF
MRFLKGNELLFRLVIINICSGISVGLLNLIIPLYALSLSATNFEIGLIKAMMGVGDLLIILPAGFLIDHFGSKRMYSASALTGGLVIVVLICVGSPRMLLLMMIMYGITRTVRSTALNASFFQNIETIGVKKAGIYRGSINHGVSFLGSLIGGIAVIYLNYTHYFLLSSMFLVIPVVSIWVFTHINGKGNYPEKNHSTGFFESFPYYRKLFRNRSMMGATFVDGMNSAFFNVFITFITVLVVKDLALSASTAAILITIRGSIQILVIFFGGTLMYRNQNNLYTLSFVMTIISLLMLGTATSVPVLVLASAVAGCFSGVMILLTFSSVGKIDGEKGKIASIFAIGGSLGSIIGPVVGGAIGEFFGIPAIFYAFIPVYAAMAAYCILLERKRIRNGEFC